MAIKEIGFHLQKLEALKSKPKSLYYIGDTKLLTKPCVAIVGSRKANQYSKQTTFKIASALAKRGVVVISGGAMGIDAMAHKGAGAKNTIAVVANGLDIHYPKVNENLLKEIEKEGLVLSRFEEGFRARSWSFPVRNEIVVALADAVIVTQAQSKSGSMVSAKLALQMQKKLYVLAHRIGESEGTNTLVQEGKAEVIYDIEKFCDQFGKVEQSQDELLEFAKQNPTYDEMVAEFGEKVFEYELEGKIVVKDGKVFAL